MDISVIAAAGLIVMLVILISYSIFFIRWWSAQKTIEANDAVRQENEQAEKELADKQNRLNMLRDQYEDVSKDYAVLEESIRQRKETLNDLIIQIDQNDKQRQSLQNEVRELNASLSDTKNSLADNIDMYAELMSQKAEESKQAYDDEYKKALKEAIEGFNNISQEKRAQIEELDANIAALRLKLDEVHNTSDAAIEERRRKVEEADKQNFYKIILPDEDLHEIEKIRSILPDLRDPEVLNKVVWTTYYLRPTQEMIGRVLGSKKPCGIYKITCIPDGRIYIGQSVNVRDRFMEHIKRGLGADPATKSNKLYPAMKKFGVENFTFELMEEVPREKLNEKERYWIDYFHSAESGLNATKGNGG